MLAIGGWCQIVLPTVTPSDLQVIWDGEVGRDQPLEVREKSTQERIMVWDSPLSSVRGSGESAKSSLFGNGNGVGGAHKVANAVFHLRALQCFSTRCHECVQGDVRAAAVFEDDVQYVEGVTPAGTAHTPHTLQSAGRERQRDTMRDASVIRDTSVRHVHDTPVRHVLRSAPGRRGTPACSAS